MGSFDLSSSRISLPNNGMQGSKPFKITTVPEKVGRAVRVPNRVPSTGEKVFANRNNSYVFLKEALMTDHISVTFATNDSNYYAKIYIQDVLRLDMLENKAKRMLQVKVEITGVCWPIDYLTDTNGCFVGILVPASHGIQLTRSAFNGATGMSQFFPKWNKYELCILTLTILKTIQKLHNLGILFGCINPASIYIATPNEVYFVDTDCWQIEGFPALSHNQTFTPPELLRSNNSPLLFSLDQENYQIAVLTFMLMMPGKFPYAKGRNADERSSIIDMAFPFSVGGGMRRSQDAERPSGIWRIVWDHLSYQLCDGFYNSFHSDGKYSDPGKRLQTSEWIKRTAEFANSLLTPNRADSLSMFPQTFRRDGKREFVRCKICGKEHPSFYFLHSIRVKQEKIDIWERGYRVCLPCARDQSGMSFRCECCNRTFYYTNRAKILHEIGKSEFDYKKQRWCRECKTKTVQCRKCGREVPINQIREFEDRMRNLKMNVCGNCFKELIDKAKLEKEIWRNSTAQSVRCRNCGRIFSITNGEMEYFNKKGFNLPTRCPQCRKNRY